MVMKPSGVSSAQFCRDMGWGVGQRLVGNEGYGDTTIEITAIGEESIFAKAIAGPGSSPIRVDDVNAALGLQPKTQNSA